MKELTLTDHELLVSLSRQDTAAFQVLIENYFPILCRFAEKYLPDSSLAKDVVQETFIRFWNANLTFQSMNALKAYLFTSTRNGCLNLIRGRTRETNRNQEVFGNGPDAVDPALTDIVHSESIAIVYQLVNRMPPAMQEIFYLSYQEGLTVKQISERLNMKLKTVKSHKYNALVILRGKLGAGRGPLLVVLTFMIK